MKRFFRPSPQQDPSNWQAIDYKHDVYGRRSEKKVDGYGTRYLYDGPHVIAEYDGNNNLLRKYIYGPGIDQPVCMIEVAESNAAYYYHYDGLGSVVALSDSSGDTVQTYQYSVFGQPAAEYEDFPNPYMFASRRYDIEIGLYYNRARYYNPFTGRFLQTDPAGDGMNLYAYCGNSPIGRTDPSGLYWYANDRGDSVWVNDAMSGVPASLVNVVFELARRSGNSVSGWIPDADILQARFEGELQTFIEDELGLDEWSNDAFNNPGINNLIMGKANEILNVYLNEVDPDGFLPRYEAQPYSGNTWDTIEVAVSDIGPVVGVYIESATEQSRDRFAVALLHMDYDIEWPACNCADSAACSGDHYLWADPSNHCEQQLIQYVSAGVDGVGGEARSRSSHRRMWETLFLIPLAPESYPPAPPEVICPRHGVPKNECGCP